MVNYNPETVSTDYDICDRLYFEELSFERVLDIYEREKPRGVILSMGGQIPNNLALKCHRAGLRILGTVARAIDTAENRFKFSKLLDELGIDQPEWRELPSVAGGRGVRPDGRLPGPRPAVLRPERGGHERRLRRGRPRAATSRRPRASRPSTRSSSASSSSTPRRSSSTPWPSDGEIVASAIVEHVENAGVHSGDATMVLPPQKTYIETMRRVRETGRKIAGPSEHHRPVQHPVHRQGQRHQGHRVQPAGLALLPLRLQGGPGQLRRPGRRGHDGPARPNSDSSTLDLNYVGVKAPQFSFSRLKGADPTLGVEMASTGEVACLGEDVHEAFLKSLLSAGYTLPKKSILLSIGARADKQKFLACRRGRCADWA